MNRELLEKALSRPIRNPTIRVRLLRQLAESYETSAWAGEDAGFGKAIGLYREALAIAPPGTPHWFRVAANLAECIVRYPARSLEDIDQARTLLSIWQKEWPDPDPVDRAAVLDLLGAIHLELPGDHAVRREEAIRWLEAADAALEQVPQPGAGRNRAIVLSRLGLAYQGRPAGDADENRQAAARCFAKAAEVCPPRLHLEEHAAALRNLALVFAGSTDLAQVRQGIEHMNHVIDHDRRREPALVLARDLGGLANLHLRAATLGSQEDLGSALELFEKALAVPDLAASRSLEAALLTDYGAAAVEAQPPPDGAEERLLRAVELADTLEGDATMAARARFYLGRLRAARGEPGRAFRLYSESIEGLERDTEPGHSAEALAELGRRAGVIYESAIDALLQPDGDARKPSEGPLAVDRATIAEALDLLERNKARSLGVGVAQRGLAPSEEVPEDLRTAFRILRDEKRFVETRLRLNRFGRTPAWQRREEAKERYGTDDVHRGQDVEVPYLEKRLREIAAEQKVVAGKIRASDPDFDPQPRWPRLSLARAAALVRPGRAILELVTTNRASYAFVLTAGDAEAPALRAFAAPRLNDRALSELVRAEWLAPYRDYRAGESGGAGEKAKEGWRRAVAGIGHRLGDLLGFDAILEALRRDGVRELVLVPYRASHRLPLHLLPGRDGGYLCDEMAVSYAPSLHVLSLASVPGPVGDARALLVQDPDGSLAFGELEIRLARRFLADPAVLVGAECRGDAVKAAMKTAELFHYCGHATFEQRNPLLSALKLSDRPLTVAEIIGVADLTRCSLAILSGCETAQVGLSQSADEYTGLPGAFLLAGAPTVLGTQWVVDDGTGPIFMHELYRNLIEEKTSPSAAFGAALRRLRTITADEILEQFDDAGESRDTGLERLLLAARYRSDRSRPMFDDPRYWAAYILVGIP